MAPSHVPLLNSVVVGTLTLVPKASWRTPNPQRRPWINRCNIHYLTNVDVAVPRRPRVSREALPDPFAGSALDVYRFNVIGFRREVRTVLAPERLLLTDVRALRLIAGGPSRPTVVALQLDLTPAAGTQIIDRLERRGFVRRARDPSDRRATVVELTPKGARAYRRASARMARLVEEIVREVSPDGLAALRRGSEELEAVLKARAAR